MTHEEEFVKEIIEYVFAYPDDDYMTMECLCRKLHKYGLIEKKDGEWTTDFIDRKTENSSEKPNNCKPQTNRIADKKPTPIRDFMVNGKVKDEPQTDCGDFADRLAYERGVKHAWEVAQKVFNSTVTFYEAEDVAKQIDKDINVRSKDEPQTDCAWK